ncbi:hypothetical protein BN140_0372 [Methanoculleus bourgensis MS2]|uniref:Uncharacterized protein n=1 Tax=Methanoculleus bourgensis (strain ATCC 43281 / DSM 3045 / OCM 15 / MS2) TaxID=1201294 RepID=I7KXQ3_METBM|nr:hypothetical protein [Methanoculleus bourgensis]CCJ35295.1 hypothetical protein BN140_0372 [Methanoculleus bourgensis MS2]
MNPSRVLLPRQIRPGCVAFLSLQIRDDRLWVPVPDQPPCCPALGPVAPIDHERSIRSVA